MSDLKITNLEFVKDSVVKLAETLVKEKQIKSLNSIRFKYDFLMEYSYYADRCGSANEALITTVEFRTIYDFRKQENGIFCFHTFGTMQQYEGMEAVAKSIEDSFRIQLGLMHQNKGEIKEVSTIVPF